MVLYRKCDIYFIRQSSKSDLWIHQFARSKQFFSFRVKSHHIFFGKMTIGIFRYLVQLEEWDIISGLWNLEQMESVCLETYFNLNLYQIFVVDNLVDIFAQGGGLFTTRTVDRKLSHLPNKVTELGHFFLFLEWLWSAIDPLKLFMNPTDGSANLFVNDTSEAFAIQNKNTSGFYTGKSDISKVSSTFFFSFSFFFLFEDWTICGLSRTNSDQHLGET